MMSSSVVIFEKGMIFYFVLYMRCVFSRSKTRNSTMIHIVASKKHPVGISICISMILLLHSVAWSYQSSVVNWLIRSLSSDLLKSNKPDQGIPIQCGDAKQRKE